MNKILLLFIIIFGLTNAQTYRLFYDVKSTPDSTTSEHQKHIMVLDVNPKDTKYYDYAFLEKDSINKALNLHDTNWTEQIPVVRKRNTHKNTNYRMIEFTLYSYETEDPIKWALTDDVKSYAGFKVQKATSHFGGRDWTAWFTKEIPFSEGPYKFQGLPGLIVLLEDSQQQYSFSLVKSKNLPQTYNTDNILEVRYGQRPLAVTEKIYIAKAIEYFNDPFHKVMEGLRNGTVTNYEDNGTKYTRPEQLIPLIKEEQGYILRDNNPIEKNKAIKYPVKK